MEKLYTVKQLQGTEWVVIWSSSAKNSKEAREKARNEIVVIVEEDK